MRESAWTISRFKGLGEMSAEQLWETTLNPDTRRLARVDFGSLSRDETSERFQLLMGRTEASSRRAWLEEKGHHAEVDI
jgi:topoisomerase-4 subunit B